MTRLIDADALLNRMQEDPLFDLVERYGISGVINAEPTVDAVPVIRCKDCKYWQLEHYVGGQCMSCQMMNSDDVCPTEPTHFCGWAERKEE